MWLILATFGSSPMLFAHAVPDGADSQPATLYCSGVVSAAVCTALLFVSHNLLNLVAFWLILVTFDSSSMLFTHAVPNGTDSQPVAHQSPTVCSVCSSFLYAAVVHSTTVYITIFVGVGTVFVANSRYFRLVSDAFLRTSCPDWTDSKPITPHVPTLGVARSGSVCAATVQSTTVYITIFVGFGRILAHPSYFRFLPEAVCACRALVRLIHSQLVAHHLPAAGV